MMENKNSHYSKYDKEYNATGVALMLANMPHPQITSEAQQRIANHIQQSLPIITSKQSRVLRFPAQSVWQLTACLAIFILIMVQFGIPVVTHTDALEQVLPIQRIEELKDVELASIAFS